MRGKRVERAATHQEDIDCNGMVDGDIDLDGEMDWGEDTNYNGILDDGEDIDNLGTLDREYWTETDANNSDTDNDGLDDGVERGLDRSNAPKDSDTKSNEVNYDADPRTTTDPLHIDSDGDGLPDGWKDGWGFDETSRLWGKWAQANGIKERGVKINVDGHTIVLAEYEDKNLNGAVEGDENCDDVMDGWETWTETSANNGDTDGDGATDGQECAGWYVTLFYESDPTKHETPIKVCSDPLDEDSDNDGLTDAEEMIYGGNPNKEDTDGDGYLDNQEFSNGSTLSGKEANPPRISLYVDPDVDWVDVYFLGLDVGDRPITSIYVEVQGIDVSGIKDISVNVKSSGLFGGKEETKTENGMNFVDTFTFSFGMMSLVGEIWTGWTVTAEVTDNGGNTNKTVYHVKSGVQVVLDLVGETMNDLYKAGKDFLWNMVETSYYLVEEGLKNGGKNTFDRIVSKGAGVFDNVDGGSNFYDSIELVLGTIFNPVDKLLSTFTDFVEWAMVILKRVLDEVWNDLSNLFNRGITMIKNLFMPEGYEDVEVDEEEQETMMDEISELDDSEESINGYIMDKLRAFSDPVDGAMDDYSNTASVTLDHLYFSPEADDYAVLLCTQENWNDAEQFEDALVPRGYQIVKLNGDMATSENLETTLEKLIYMTGDNDNVVVNIASHGSKGSFILNDGIRSYGWLDELLDKIPAKITIIIDSCYSGSALPHLGQPGREVYVACGADELSTGEYDRRFAEALGGVGADVDGDGVVEMWEADRWGRWEKMFVNLNKHIEINNIVEVSHITYRSNKVALLIGEPSGDEAEAIEDAYDENHDLLEKRGYQIFGGSKLSYSEIWTEIDKMGDYLRNLGTKNNKIYVCFIGHGDEENKDRFELSVGDPVAWDYFSFVLDLNTLGDKDDAVLTNKEKMDPWYESMVIVISTCYSKYAEDNFTENDLVEKRVFISIADKNEIASLITGPINKIIFMTHFINMLEEDCWGEFLTVFCQVLVVGIIFSLIVAAFMLIIATVVALVALSLFLIIGLLCGLYAMIDIADFGGPSCKISDAYRYAASWTEFGLFFCLNEMFSLPMASSPSIYNYGLAQEITL